MLLVGRSLVGGVVFNVVSGVGWVLVVGVGTGELPESGQKWGESYGMELPRVGAFTDFRGSGYRNPVHFWA